MADPQEEGDPIRKISGYEPTNCDKVQGPSKVPTLNAAETAAKVFIKKDKTHYCCNVSQGQSYFVQRWKRPEDQSKVVLKKAGSTNTTFYCHVKLPVNFKEDRCSECVC